MESQEHIDLVEVIIKYIKSIIPNNSENMIIKDSSGNIGDIRVVGNYAPDAYYRYNDFLIIGEAKTEKDFSRLHSILQYKAYVEECELFEGRSVLVIAIPWELTITAKNYFARLKRQNNLSLEIVIINELGRSVVL